MLSKVQNMTLGVYVNHLPESPSSCFPTPISQRPVPVHQLLRFRCSTAMLTMTNTHTSPQTMSIYSGFTYIYNIYTVQYLGDTFALFG